MEAYSPDRAREEQQKYQNKIRLQELEYWVNNINFYLGNGFYKFKIQVSKNEHISSEVMDSILSMYKFNWSTVNVDKKLDFWHGWHYEWEFIE